MALTYTKITSETLSSSQPTVVFSSIPQTYTDLLIKVSARLDQSESPPFLVRFNGDTATNYSFTFMRSTYSSTSDSGRQSNYSLGTAIAYAPGPAGTANTFSNNELYIPNYTGSTNKLIYANGVSPQNSTANAEIVVAQSSGYWRNTAAITSITILNTNPYNWVSGATFYLYGIKNF